MRGRLRRSGHPDGFYRTHNAVEAFDGLSFVREATPLDGRSATDG